MADLKLFAEELVDLSVTMHQLGTPLMQRILPPDTPVDHWQHYPFDDAVSPTSGSRYFYHCHPPEERGADEHGHFHLFLPLSLFDRYLAVCRPLDDATERADVVHVVALSVANSGVPTALFTVNRWVTDEWLFSAEDIIARLDLFDLHDAGGDALVDRWLTCFVALARDSIAALLFARDAQLAALGWSGEERAAEVMSSAPIDLSQMIEAAISD